MSQAPAARQYQPAVIWLHWIVLILIAAAYALIEFREIYPKGSAPREFMKMLHFSCGLTVFALVWVRIVLRLRAPTPAVEPPLTPFLQVGAVGAHVALYLFMIVMPLLGWLTLSAEGKPVVFFGLHLFPLMGESETVAEFAEELHETIGKIGYALIGLHALAALYHHYIRRDDTVARMLPFLRK